MWWQRGTIYQIYPRSFQDTDGDGVGDLEGIRRRLPYLKDLGVDAIWLSPVFASPMADFGYDISDHCAIDPLFGTMADFDRLLAEAHALGLKLILDFVPNHTSDQHRWFRDPAKRDWYIWRDPAPGGGPPNNWLSHFGGSAWEWDEASGQYYYHAYLRQQPDLDWRNPEVREAMHDVLRFWLGRGVDGVRVDVMWHLAKDPEFRDNPPNPGWRPGRPAIESLLPVHSEDRPEVHEIVAGMRAVIDEYPDRVLIGETYLPIDRLVTYYGEGGKGAHLPFNFHLIETPWNPRAIANLIARYEAALPDGAWPNWVLGNHDRPRIAARIGEAQARNAALLLLTLRGTPTLYYGDELGIGDVEIAEAKDQWALNEPDGGIKRDASRTPMQWSADTNAGFSTASPWLPLTDDYSVRNVEAQATDPASMLSLHRALLKLRREEPALRAGEYRLLFADDALLGYERVSASTTRIAIVLNLTDRPRELRLPPEFAEGNVLWPPAMDRPPAILGPHEAIIVRGCARSP